MKSSDTAAVNASHGKSDVEGGGENEGEPLLPPGFKMVKLNADIYTLFFTAPVVSASFAFACLVFLLQLSIMVLVFSDTLDQESDTNPFKIPAGVDIAVTVGQAICMFLLPRIIQDLLDGVEFVIDGYHETKCPNASVEKWFLSGFLHFGVGALMVFNLFAILMQQTRVIDLAAKITGFYFFSNIDNLAYGMAAKGFFGPSLKKDVDHASEIEVPRSGVYTWGRRIADTFVTVLLLVGFGVLSGWQISGKYLCDSVFIQLGDAYNPLVVELAGMFDMKDGRINNRAVYSERLRGEYNLAYCGDLRAWTLVKGTDPCASGCNDDIIAKSGVDEGYSILATADSWKIEDVFDGGYKPFVHFHLACNECDSKCSSKHGRCDAGGNCVCDKDHYGVNCEFASPCPFLTLDKRTSPFPRAELGLADIPSDFSLLTLDDGSSVSQERGNVFQLEFRPVYYGVDKNGNIYVLFFAGRRWVVSLAEFEDFYPENTTEVVDYMSDPEKFSTLYSSYHTLYASAPMDVGTKSDGLTPESLDWFYVGHPEDANEKWWHVHESEPTHTQLLCGLCDHKISTCENYGTCGAVGDIMGTCTCDPGYDGAKCEKAFLCTDKVDSDEYDPLKTLGCEMNGTCSSSGLCSCPVGYYGNLCQFDADCVELGNFCLNGGVCNQETHMCDECLNSTSGPLCQFPSPPMGDFY